MNILLIEKEEAIIQILEAFFMKEKWNYDIATDGVIGTLSLIHISEPTRRLRGSRMPSSA